MVLLGFTGFYWVLLGFIGAPDWVLSGCNRVLLGVARLNFYLPGFYLL